MVPETGRDFHQTRTEKRCTGQGRLKDLERDEGLQSGQVWESCPDEKTVVLMQQNGSNSRNSQDRERITVRGHGLLEIY